MKPINILVTPDNPDEDLSDYLTQLQTHVRELMGVRSLILEEEDKINSLIQVVQDLIITEPENLHNSEERISVPNHTGNSGPSLHDTVRLLEEAVTAILSQYNQIAQSMIETLPDIISPDFEIDNTDVVSLPRNIPKISLYLIHDNIYTLTKLIHHYTQLEFFKIFPHFSISSALETINPETDGLILISSSLIRNDPILVIRTIREHTISMPVIVMEDKDHEIGEIVGFNGTVKEECPLSEILERFLSGLRTQAIERTISHPHLTERT